MAKYFKASDYYPDDKDIYDFLDSQTRSNEPMYGFLRSINIFSSKLANKEHLQKYISLLYLDWESANKLVDSVNIKETENKVSNYKMKLPVELEIVESAVNTVKEDRCERNREVYNIRKIDDEIILDVTYIDVDTSKTRVLQKREKDLQIIMSKIDDDWTFRYSNNQRAKTILEDVKKQIISDIEIEETPEIKIDISHIKSHEIRVEFFKKMMSEIDGLRLLDVSNIKVDRLPIENNEDQTDEDEDQDLSDELEKKLKKVVMYGADLFTVREFQELVRDGFFISSAQWKSQKSSGDPEIIEFSAGFNSSSEGKDFDYKVLGVYRLDDSGNPKVKREHIYGNEKNHYLTVLENSAYNALSLSDQNITDDVEQTNGD